MVAVVPVVNIQYHVGETGWWMRTVAAAVMLGIAMATVHRRDLRFYSSVLSFVAFVALPSVESISAIVDESSDRPFITFFALAVMITIIWLVPFVVGLVIGTTPPDSDSELTPRPISREEQRDAGYVVTAIAVFAVLMTGSMPSSVSNVLMGLTLLPLAMGAVQLGASVARNGPEPRVPTPRALAKKTLTSVLAVLLMLFLLSMRRIITNLN